jgi:hypothetical protein
VHASVDLTRSNAGCGSELMKPGNGILGPVAERRKRPRAALHWAILITRGAYCQPLETTTINVSSEGFYCLLSEAVTAGERVECTIRIPARSQDRSDVWLCLQCRAQVLRVEKYGVPGIFGVAFRIEDYTVARLTPDRLPLA